MVVSEQSSVLMQRSLIRRVQIDSVSKTRRGVGTNTEREGQEVREDIPHVGGLAVAAFTVEGRSGSGSLSKSQHESRVSDLSMSLDHDQVPELT